MLCKKTLLKGYLNNYFDIVATDVFENMEFNINNWIERVNQNHPNKNDGHSSEEFQSSDN